MSWRAGAIPRGVADHRHTDQNLSLFEIRPRVGCDRFFRESGVFDRGTVKQSIEGFDPGSE